MRISGQPSRMRLYRNRRKGKCLGVCAGIADYFDVSPTPIRIAAVVGLFTITVPTLVIYFLAAWIMDDRPKELYESEEEETFWRAARKEPAGTARELRHKFRECEQRLRGLEAHVTSSEFELNRKFRDLGD